MRKFYLIALSALPLHFTIHSLHAQCLITVDAGEDIYLCESQGTPVSLSGQVGGPVLDFQWTPATGLNNPVILSPEALVQQTTTYVLTGSAIEFNNNLVINGDFEAGNTGFTSEYMYSPGSLQDPYSYDVTPSPQTGNDLFSPCTDHTSGSGNMLVALGGPGFSKNIWCQTVQVTPGTRYFFSAWVSSVYSFPPPAVISLRINGQIYYASYVTSSSCSWALYELEWNSGTNAQAELCISLSKVSGTKAIAIDDIRFVPVCNVTDSVTVHIIEYEVVASPSIADIPCNGSSVTLNGQGSIAGPDISYLWETTDGHIVSGANTLNPIVDAAGTYTFSVIYDNGSLSCIKSTSVYVKENNILYSWIDEPLPVNCSTSTILLSGHSTQQSYSTYHWTASQGGHIAGPVNNPSTLVDQPGTYTLLVTNSVTGCTSESAVVIGNVFNLPVAQASAGQLDCLHAQVVLAGGGSSSGPGFTYLWSTTNGNILSGQDSLNAVTGTPGMYILLVTNTSNHCVSADTVMVMMNTVPPVALIQPANQISCEQPSFSLSAAGSSVGPPFVYAWTASPGGFIVNGSDSLSPVVNAPGWYFLLVTDTQNGCTATDSVLVTADTTAVIAVVGAPQALNCFAQQVLLDASGSSPSQGLVYQWSSTDGHIVSGGDTAAPLVDAPGMYQLLLTNPVNGCTGTASVTVVAHDPVVVSVTEMQNVRCFDDLGGSASIAVSGGNGAYTYYWSHGATAGQIANLGAGIYSVTVSDGDGCTASVELSIGQPDPIVAIGSSTPPSANGSADGVASVLVSGGTPGFNYLWTTGATTPQVNGLSPGIYTVTITDANGCTLELAVEVMQAACNLSAEVSVQAPGCHGAANGQATLMVVDGVDPLVYQWSSGSAGPVADGLTSGIYTYTVTDAAGCDLSGAVEVPEPEALIVAVETLENTSCPNTAEGTATVAASGGTGQIQFNWSNGHSGATASGLMPGSYTVIATDANGCSAEVPVVIASIDTIAPEILVANTSVTLGPSGSVELTLANLSVSLVDNCGISGYSIGTTSFDCSQLGANPVAITAIDNSGNSTTVTVVLTVLDNLPPSVECSGDIVRCADAPEVEYLAPVATDNCLVQGGQFNLLSGLPSGSTFPPGTTTNTYTFTDASGNVGSCSFNVTILEPVMITLDTILPDMGNQKVGEVQVTIGGSQPGYTYQWTLDGQTVATTEDLTGAGIGVYNLLVTDAIGCTATAGPFEVTNVSGTNNPVWMDLVGVFPNPTAGKLYVLLPDDLINKDVQITVNDITGRRVLEQQFSQQKQLRVDLSAFAEGMYTIAVLIDGQQGVWKVVRSR